jgi:hypothetical protein
MIKVQERVVRFFIDIIIYLDFKCRNFRQFVFEEKIKNSRKRFDKTVRGKSLQGNGLPGRERNPNLQLKIKKSIVSHYKIRLW